MKAKNIWFLIVPQFLVSLFCYTPYYTSPDIHVMNDFKWIVWTIVICGNDDMLSQHSFLFVEEWLMEKWWKPKLTLNFHICMTCMKCSVTKRNAFLQQVLQYYSNTCIEIMKGIKLAKIHLSSRNIVTNAISIQPYTQHICKLCETWIRGLSAGNHGMQIHSFAINYFHVFLSLWRM
jgi:hypothetical protein